MWEKNAIVKWRLAKISIQFVFILSLLTDWLEKLFTSSSLILSDKIFLLIRVQISCCEDNMDSRAGFVFLAAFSIAIASKGKFSIPNGI